MRDGKARAGAARGVIGALALAGAAAVAGAPALGEALASDARPASGQPVAFVETFNGRPAAPEPWRPTNWDVTFHTRDRDTWLAPVPMLAHHGPDCSAAPNTHELREAERAVYLCNDHVMTAINGGSYGLIYLTPNHLVDFSGGEAVVRFDMSTFRSSPRDWVDVWISPYDDHLQLPAIEWLPDLGGEPRRAVSLHMDLSHAYFRASVVDGFRSRELPQKSDARYEEWLIPSAVRRDTFELRISRTRIKFGMPQYDRWWIDAPMADLGWDRGVVQLGHHSYDPTKCDGGCGPNTWHWDNVQIEPAVPFTMIHADRSYVDRSTDPTVTFAQPAPADSYLRFAGIGNALHVSFDDGATWYVAQPRPQKRAKEEAFKSYWLPIPEGTRRVQFRGEGWFGGDWHVKALSIWSRTGPAQQVGGSCGLDGACPSEGGAEE
jgi:hypothetical protein